MAGRHQRKLAIELIDGLRTDPGIEVVENDADLFSRGWELYRRRLDKAWSLTDCISFVVMREWKIVEALTHDHHFKQAGFRILL